MNGERVEAGCESAWSEMWQVWEKKSVHLVCRCGLGEGQALMPAAVRDGVVSSERRRGQKNQGKDRQMRA